MALPNKAGRVDTHPRFNTRIEWVAADMDDVTDMDELTEMDDIEMEMESPGQCGFKIHTFPGQREMVVSVQERIDRAQRKALGSRSFHLPMNATWCEDWRQYLANTHPLWGVCCADRLNPIPFIRRLLTLVTSVFVGFTFVNLIHWWSVRDEATWTKQKVLSVSFSSNVTQYMETAKESQEQFLDLNMEMIFLVTWVGCAHALHDCIVWYWCCFQTTCAHWLWLLVWGGASISFYGLVAAENDNLKYDFPLMLSHTAAEICCAWFLWYPVVATAIFSGILGCGRFPVLGGRPRDLYLEQERRFKQRG